MCMMLTDASTGMDYAQRPPSFRICQAGGWSAGVPAPMPLMDARGVSRRRHPTPLSGTSELSAGAGST